jgi:hypothetical protein
VGSKIAPDIGRRGTSGSFYGNENPQKLLVRPAGRRTMPGGPLLPRLPHNPFAIAARKIGRVSRPYQPTRLNDMF